MVDTPPLKTPVKERDAMIRSMSPHLQQGSFVFCQSERQDLVSAALASFREPEGLSLIVPMQIAQAAGLDVALPMVCITLNVHSALDGVGLTAAVSAALAQENIPCNIVAAYHHDHVFVPERSANRALALLNETAQMGTS